MNAQSNPLSKPVLKLILWTIDVMRPLDVLLGLSLIVSSLMFIPLGFFVFGSWSSFIFLPPLHLLIGLLFIFQPFRLGGQPGRSESMMPTIMPGDVVFLNPLSVFWRGQRKRSDIVLFQRPKHLIDVTGSVQRLCKRVIGLPGDTIRVESGIGVFINDQILDESTYVKEPPRYNLATLGDIGGLVEKDKEFFPYKNGAESNQPIVVPPGHFFILGDNRNYSLDSHHFGFVDQKLVVASVLYVWKLKPRPVHTPLMKCSYCQKSQNQVRKLIQGPDRVFICNDCVLLSEVSLRTKKQTIQTPSGNVVCSFCKKTVDAADTVGETFKICSECLDLCKEILLEKSVDDCSKDIAENPTSDSAYAARAHAYAREKQYTKAAEDWNKTIELNPTNAEYYLARGNNYTELFQYEQAIGDLTTSINLNPKLVNAYCCRSFVYIQLGKLEDAIADSEQTILLDPKNATAHNNKGKSLFLLGRLEEALPCFDKAIALEMISYPIFFYNRGCVLQSLDQQEKAIADFTKALEIDPKLAKAYEGRANAYEAMGKHQLAEQDREKFKQTVERKA